MRGSTTICHSSATAAGANLAGKTAFSGNNRAVNGCSACLGDSGRDTSTEQPVSSNIANTRDCGSDYDEFGACRSDLAKFTKCYHRGDRDCGSDYDEFGACRCDLAKFTKSYRHGSVRF